MFVRLVILLCLCGVALQSPVKTEGVTKPPVPPEGPHRVYGLPPGVSYEERDLLGQYAHGFVDPESGADFSEEGRLLSTNEGWEYVIVKEGQYSYVSPEGQKITVRYIADHNGYRVLPNDE